MALPLHPEYRTLPMLFYVPPLLPRHGAGRSRGRGELLHLTREGAAAPQVPGLALHGGGTGRWLKDAYRKLMAVRLHRRAKQVGDLATAIVTGAMAEAGLSATAADDIYRLTSLASMDERIAVPPMMRAGFAEPTVEPQRQNAAGLAYLRPPPGR